MHVSEYSQSNILKMYILTSSRIGALSRNLGAKSTTVFCTLASFSSLLVIDCVSHKLCASCRARRTCLQRSYWPWSVPQGGTEDCKSGERGPDAGAWRDRTSRSLATRSSSSRKLLALFMDKEFQVLVWLFRSAARYMPSVHAIMNVHLDWRWRCFRQLCNRRIANSIQLPTRKRITKTHISNLYLTKTKPATVITTICEQHDKMRTCGRLDGRDFFQTCRKETLSRILCLHHHLPTSPRAEPVMLKIECERTRSSFWAQASLGCPLMPSLGARPRSLALSVLPHRLFSFSETQEDETALHCQHKP